MYNSNALINGIRNISKNDRLFDTASFEHATRHLNCSDCGMREAEEMIPDPKKMLLRRVYCPHSSLESLQAVAHILDLPPPMLTAQHRFSHLHDALPPPPPLIQDDNEEKEDDDDETNDELLVAILGCLFRVASEIPHMMPTLVAVSGFTGENAMFQGIGAMAGGSPSRRAQLVGKVALEFLTCKRGSH